MSSTISGLSINPAPIRAGHGDRILANSMTAARAYLAALTVTVAFGAVVLIEPAPFDLGIMILVAVGLLLRYLKMERVHEIPIVLLAVFGLANVLSMTDMISWTRGVWYLAVTVYLMVSTLFFAMVTSAMGIPAIKAIGAGYLFGGLVNVVLAAGAFFSLLPWRDVLLLNGRCKGLFKDPNVYGPYLVPIVVYSAAVLLTDRSSFQRAMLWSAIALTCVGGLFLSFSRACWMNCLLSLAVYSVISVFQSKSLQEAFRKVAVFALIPIAGVVVVYGLANLRATSSMLKLRLGNNGLQDYDRMRFHTHSLAIESALHDPIGIGPGQSEIAFEYATHSTYLRVLSENGAIGAGSLMLLFVLSVARSAKVALTQIHPFYQRLGAVLAACLVGQLVNCIFIDSVHWRHFWFLLGLAWTVPRSDLKVPETSLMPRRQVPGS